MCFVSISEALISAPAELADPLSFLSALSLQHTQTHFHLTLYFLFYLSCNPNDRLSHVHILYLIILS